MFRKLKLHRNLGTNQSRQLFTINHDGIGRQQAKGIFDFPINVMDFCDSAILAGSINTCITSRNQTHDARTLGPSDFQAFPCIVGYSNRKLKLCMYKPRRHHRCTTGNQAHQHITTIIDPASFILRLLYFIHTHNPSAKSTSPMTRKQKKLNSTGTHL